MKNTTVLATEAACQGESVSSAWESQPTPIRPALGYLTVPLPDTHDLPALLLCDPLTGLVAYPSFEAYMIAVLPGLATDGLHLAIGDVDDLRGYVTAAKADEPNLFGHLAGNDCMRRVGEATRRWAVDILDSWPFAVCATFGGDEVIVAAAGWSYDVFIDTLTELISRIRSAAPRPCSFASATTKPMAGIVSTAADAYRDLVSRVDKCLFYHKASARNAGSTLAGALVDVGTLELFGHPGMRRHQPARQRSFNRLSAEGDNHAS
jgi:GGDEF domain-containing protein